LVLVGDRFDEVDGFKATQQLVGYTDASPKKFPKPRRLMLPGQEFKGSIPGLSNVVG